MISKDEHLKLYINGWISGASNKPPSGPEAVTLRGHQHGVMAMKAALELEREQIGLDAGSYTMHMLRADAERALRPRSDMDGNSESSTVTVPAVPAKDLANRESNMMFDEFASIRARYAKQMGDIPTGCRKIEYYSSPEQRTQDADAQPETSGLLDYFG